MFSSTIIPTIGRQSVHQSIKSVVSQASSGFDFEVIVVNDSGKPLAIDGKYDPKMVKLINTNCRGLSVARNTGASVARGKYLHFLDDDDWLVHGALNCFRELSNEMQDASWLYGGVEFVDDHGKIIGHLNLGLSGNRSIHALAGSWIPAQASFIRRDAFFRAGGFDPRFPVAEETDLLRRITLDGDLGASSKTVVQIFRGGAWRTSGQYELGPEFNRWSRDRILDHKKVFTRLLGSADTNYWYGRLFRAYFTSIFWNLRRYRMACSMSRALYVLLSLLVSNIRILSLGFWKAVFESQVPSTQAKVLGI